MAQHIEIQRLIMIEYRLNKLRHLAETGTTSQKAAADAKIEEILAAEEARQ